MIVERFPRRLPELAPGETRRFTLEFVLHSGSAAVADAARRIAALQGGDAPRIETKSPSSH